MDLASDTEHFDAPDRSDPVATPEGPTGPRRMGGMVAAGAIWTVLQSIGTKAILFFGQIVLAYLLSPDDFGMIGLAYTVTAFVALLVNPGIDVILVRRGRRFHLWSTPAFFFGLFTAAIGFLVILAVAPFAAHWYNTPELVGVLSVLAFATPLASLLLVPTAKLRSEMRFRSISLVMMFQTLLQTGLTLGFAAAGFRAYSFVLPMPIVYTVSAVILWIIARPKIKFCNPIRHWKYLVGDSSFILGSRVLHTATGQADYMVLGSLYGAIVVGPYYFAYVLAAQAIRLSAGSMGLVLTAGLSRMPAFSTQQTLAALRATRSVSLLGIPICLLQAALVDPLLRALYGEKWLAAIPLAQVLSIAMAIDVPSWAAGTLLEARGQFRLTFYLWIIISTLLVTAIVIGAYFGAAWGTAIAVCSAVAIYSPLFTVWLLRTAGVTWRELARVYFLPFAIAALGAGSALIVGGVLAARGFHVWVQFGLAATVGTIVTLAASLVFARDWISDIAAQIKHALPRIRIARKDRRSVSAV